MILRELRRLRGERSGNVAVFFGLGMSVIIGFGALATDFGSVYLDHRALQAATDAAALAAVRSPDEAGAIAAQVFDASAQGDVRIDIVFGTYDPKRPPDQRFEASDEGSASVLRVIATRNHKFGLARVLGVEDVDMVARADAAISRAVVFHAGSRLLDLDMPIVNKIARDLLGAELSLTFLDYHGLVNADIRLGDLLGGISLDATNTASIVAQLHEPTGMRTLLTRMADSLEKQNATIGAVALRKAANSPLASVMKLSLDDLLDVDAGGFATSRTSLSQLLSAEVSVLNILDVALKRSINGLTADIGLDVPLVGSVDLGLLLGEPGAFKSPLAVASMGERIELGQLRQRLHVRTLPLLGSLGIGEGLNLPVESVVAGGRVDVAEISCAADPLERSVTLAVTPGLLRLSLGASSKPLAQIGVGDRVGHAPILSLLLLAVEARANLAIESMQPVRVTFTGTDVAKGTVKTARTSNFLASPISSLFGQTDLRVRLGGLGLSTGLVTSAVRNGLTSLVQPLDLLLGKLLKTAGIGLGEVDVQVEDILCERSRIVG
ncbi:hypothetical protein DYI37_15090 [Fulvimarina endophytica]|uniref:Putative Flp pilus-assembly TadG-like N-terminal domain-containing protein n=1 Tax=Fulvimarina endophytica TaxID=2293836 RepID=A0A371X0M1_9HYPH|nr:pilus assembly protein TadG-related protein [Fulvimarina endophytica]RFC62574.1 hypothetical protein DYI37_15090 [Fulvimarina endophytica]